MEEVGRELENPDIWLDPERAQAFGKEHASLETIVSGLDRIQRTLDEALELFHLAEAEQDEETLQDIAKEVTRVAKEIEGLEFRRMFSGEMDRHNAYMDIQAGSGGTEAQDWAEMLLRMYLRWGESHGFNAEILEASPGEVAGLKSATVLFEGEYGFGWLRTETGVHRLVRKSPFDAGHRRHTSFAAVFVSPELEEDIEVEIDPSDLRVDVYRASGAGGQHVNKTESAIRITHIPTGLVVTCQDESSQHKNRAAALKVLKSRLLAAEQEKAAAERAEERKSLVSTGDRSAKIRTYNFPQGRVTDHRINFTTYRLQEILDGNITEIIEQLKIAEQQELLAAATE